MNVAEKLRAMLRAPGGSAIRGSVIEREDGAVDVKLWSMVDREQAITLRAGPDALFLPGARPASVTESGADDA